MLTITNQSDYGFLFLSFLLDKERYVSISELAGKLKLPRRFLAKICATLVKRGIVKSKEGKVGGYKLAVDLNRISLYEYLSIFEKDVAITKCAWDSFECPYDSVCMHKSFLRNKLNVIVVSELKKTKLRDIF